MHDNEQEVSIYNTMSGYEVLKRNGKKERVSFDKVIYRLEPLCKDLNREFIDPIAIALDTIRGFYPGIKTEEIDDLSANICAHRMMDHPDYNKLAARICISSLHKKTHGSFKLVIEELYNHKDEDNEPNKLISDEIYQIVQECGELIESKIDYERDFLFDFFGFKTLERSYLTRIKKNFEDVGTIVERPQDTFMRVALGIHGKDLDRAFETYDLMSQKFLLHASPTLFNAGTQYPQCSSCFLLYVPDSIDGIADNWKECALISKRAGGIGITLSDIRAKGSRIRGTNGQSDGIVPLCQVLNALGRYVNQCFVPETPIFTDKGYKQIIDIKINDMVMTSNGTFKRVNKVFAHNVEKDILKIKTTHSFETINCTNEHDIYVLQNVSEELNFKHIQNKLKNGTYSPKFVKASELNEGDYMFIPKMTIDKDTQYSEHDYYFLGLFLGNGHITNEYSVINVANAQEFIKKYLKNNSVNYCETSYPASIKWSNSENIFINFDDVYDENGEKIFADKFITGNKNKLLMLIKGLLDSNGSIDTEIYFNTPSKKLAYSMRYILTILGIMTSCNITTNKFKYVIIIPKVAEIMTLYGKGNDSYNLNYIETDDYYMSKITSIEKENYNGKVYDLNIEQNHNYLTSSGIVHNSGRRKGSIAVYIEPHHADIFDFLELKTPQGQEDKKARDLFLALWVSDLFMKQVEEDGDWYLMCPHECPGLTTSIGDKFEELYWSYVKQGKYRKKIKAYELYEKIIDTQIETGMPYMTYKDSVNKKSNQQNIGIIKQSNLCVAPETKILTKEGYITIKDLKNKEIDVWNGSKWSSVTVKHTGENKELLKVKFSNHQELECTPEHKFYILNSYSPKKPTIKDAKDLVEGDKIIKCTFPIIDNDFELMSAYDNGFFSSKGTYINQKTENSKSTAVNANYFVPMKYSLKSKLEWFAGYCDADGIIVYNQECQSLQIACSELNFLKNISMMLNTCGIQPEIQVMSEARKAMLPDGKGNQSEVDCIKEYIMLINSKDLLKLVKNGFSPNKLLIDTSHIPTRNERNFIKVEAIEYTNRTDDTYCFTEPLEHKGIFNGIITGQCNEIVEYTDENESAVCLTGDTKILTNDGYINIEDYKDQKLAVYYDDSNLNKKDVTYMKGSLIDNGIKDVYEISFKNTDFTIKATDNHQFVKYIKTLYSYVDGNNRHEEQLEWITVIDLEKDTKLYYPEFETIPKYSNMKTNNEASAISYKLSKLFSSDGSCQNDKDNSYYITLSSVSTEVLNNIKYTLQEMGIKSTISEHILKIDRRENLIKFNDIIGFKLSKQKQSKLEEGIEKMKDLQTTNQNKFLTVKEVKLIGKKQVYDISLPEKHTFIADSLVSHNCNLANLVLPTYLDQQEDDSYKYNYNKLEKVARIATRNLNRVIDINFYPNEKTKYSNLKHRPIGLGVQGLANVYNKLKIAFDSDEAIKVNKAIFETIYYGALCESVQLAKEEGPYETFKGSPFSKGKLQWHLWGLSKKDLIRKELNWDQLIKDIKEHGTRNSLLTALMPTASTSQIMGCNEAFEPYTTNLYTRKTLAGSYIVVNEDLIKDLIAKGIWTKSVRDQFLYYGGSVQEIDEVPQDIKNIYKTAYEMKQSWIIKQAASRGPFIDQTQSMNLFMDQVDSDVIGSLHHLGWELGLKTGLYYLRGKPGQDAIQFGLDPDVVEKLKLKQERKKNLSFKYLNESSSDSQEDEHIEKEDEYIEEEDDYIEEEDEYIEENETKKYCKFSIDGNTEGCLACQ